MQKAEGFSSPWQELPRLGQVLSTGHKQGFALKQLLEPAAPSARCTFFNWFDGIFWIADHCEVIKNLCSVLNAILHLRF